MGKRVHHLELDCYSSHEILSWVKAPPCEINFSESEARGKRVHHLELDCCSSHEILSWVKEPPCELNFSASFARGKIKSHIVTASHELSSWLHVANDLVFRNRNYFFNGTPAGSPNQATIQTVTNFKVTRSSPEPSSWEKGSTNLNWTVIVATKSFRGLRRPRVNLIFPRASPAEKF
ncbi:MAG: hypothetical protein ACJAYM_000990 [Flavobacteriales bacterium]